MDMLRLIIYAILIVLAGSAFLLISLQIFHTNQMSRRMKDFIDEDTRKPTDRQQVATIARQFSGSLASRIIFPYVRNIAQFFGRLTPAGLIEYIQKQLLIAGNPNNLGWREIVGMCIILGFVGFGAGFLYLRREISMLNLLLAILIGVLSTMLPIYWLRAKALARQKKIRKGLPDALDMLSICATAGLGFDQAMQRIAEYWNTPIGLEFGRLITEMEMGLSRRDALRNMSDRIQVNEVSSFVAFVLQSEQIGMSISDTLRTHAAQMRVERRFKAQEQAQKIPTKMLIPLVFLIFPALLAVILGPALPDLVGIFKNL